MFRVMKTLRLDIAIGVAIAHIATGIAILWSGGDGAVHTTPLALLSSLVPPVNLAIWLILAGGIALIPFLRSDRVRWLFVVCLTPQQLLLLCHLISVITAISLGRYPDGYIPAGGAFFIFTDQIWLLMIVLFHCFEYSDTIRKK